MTSLHGTMVIQANISTKNEIYIDNLFEIVQERICISTSASHWTSRVLGVVTDHRHRFEISQARLLCNNECASQSLSTSTSEKEKKKKNKNKKIRRDRDDPAKDFWSLVYNEIYFYDAILK